MPTCCQGSAQVQPRLVVEVCLEELEGFSGACPLLLDRPAMVVWAWLAPSTCTYVKLQEVS